LNIERLLSLKPDLILLWPGSIGPAQREQLQRLNIPVYVAEPHSLEQLTQQVEAIAEQLGAPTPAGNCLRSCANAWPGCASAISVPNPCGCFTKCGARLCTPWAVGRSSAMR